MASRTELTGFFEPSRIPLRWAQEWALDALLRVNSKSAKKFFTSYSKHESYPYGDVSENPEEFPELPPGVSFLSWNRGEPQFAALLRQSEEELIEALRDGAMRAEGYVASGLSLPLEFDDFLDKDYAPEPYDGSDKGPIFNSSGACCELDRSWFYDLGDMSKFASMDLSVDLLADLDGDTNHPHYAIATDELTDDELAKVLLAVKRPEGLRCETTHLLSVWHNLLVRVGSTRRRQKIIASAFDISIPRSALATVFGEPKFSKAIFAQASQLKSKQSHSGGRPQRWDWDSMMLEAFRVIYLDGPTKRQADLVNHLKDWFIVAVDDHPHESQIKTKIQKLWRTLGL